jgi:hypothetical protein
MADIYRVFHPTTRQYTFFSAVHGTFSKIDHTLGHKASLNKFKKIEITPCIISDLNRMKLDLNNNRNPRKYSNTWKLNNTLLKIKKMDDQSHKGEFKNFLESNKTYQNLWDTVKAMLRGKFIAISAYIKKTETA